MDSFATIARHYNRLTGYPGRIKSQTDLIAPWVTEWGVRTVLDAGCGGGALMLALRRLGVEVVGLDHSQSMLELARKNTAEQGEDFQFVEASFQEAGALFPGSFDAVFSLGNAMISLAGDDEMEAALRGLRDSLHSGGHLLIQLLNLIPFVDGRKTLISHREDAGAHYLRFAVPVDAGLLFTLLAIEPGTAPQIHTSTWQLWDRGLMIDRMAAVGFQDIGVYGGLNRSDFDRSRSADLVISGRRP
jgi:SAM-dependent methyltransferase